MLQRASDVGFAQSAQIALLLSKEPGEDQREARDMAWWNHCHAVSQNLEAYLPVGCGDPPIALRPFYDDLTALREELGKPDTAALFGQWRARVTETEARNARNLEVLIGVVNKLREMRDRAVDGARVDELVRQISHFVVSEYRVIMPRDVQPRLWAIRQMRRLDLLPVEWRSL